MTQPEPVAPAEARSAVGPDRPGPAPGPRPGPAPGGVVPLGARGWRIVAVLAFTETVSWGVLYYAFAVFQVPMGAELGLSSTQLSGAFSFAVLLTGVAALAVGRWLDARGPRALMTAGSLVSSLLVAAWSQVHNALQLYLVLGGIGLVRASVLYEPAFAVIVRWFSSRRAAALLAVTVAGGFASTVALPTSNALIEAFGWRRALLVLAAVLAVCTVLPHAVILRRDPGDTDLHPDGGEAHSATEAGHAVGLAAEASWTRAARWALGHPVFRWYTAAFAAQAAAVVVVAVHLVPFLREHGHSAAFSASATGALGALSVTGRLVLTGAVRRVPAPVVTATMFAVQAVGAVVLLVAGSTTEGAVAFVLLFGLGFGAGTIARPALLADAFGTARYATIAGLLAAFTTLTTTAAPVAAGLVRTTTGSYAPVLVALAALCVGAAVCLLASDRRERAAAGGAPGRDRTP